MLKKATVALLCALLLLPALASAKDMAGKFGLGYFLSDAPVGMRYWVTPKVGLDLGVGYQLVDLGSNNANNFFFDVGLPYVVMGNDQANLFLRVGALIGIVDNRTVSNPLTGPGGVPLDDTWTDVTVTLAPGGEVFFGDSFSLEASHGIAFVFLSPPEGDSSFNVSTFGEGVSSLGFHYYW